mgnify:CR=1 FL=1
MGLIRDSLSKKVTKEESAAWMLTQTDIEFILLTIKNSMISGAMLEQAVVTVQKLQNIHKKLDSSKK